MKRKIFVVKRGKKIVYIGTNFDKANKTYLTDGYATKSFVWYVIGMPRKKYKLDNRRTL